MSEEEMRAVIAEEVRKIGSLRRAAKAWRIAPSYLCDCLNGRRAPGPAVLEPLGYERVTVVAYVRKQESST